MEVGRVDAPAYKRPVLIGPNSPRTLAGAPVSTAQLPGLSMKVE
jgi:hypothetical protein